MRSASRAGRTSTDVIDVLTDQFILRGIPGDIRSELPIAAPSVRARWTTARNSSRRRRGRGFLLSVRKPPISSQVALGERILLKLQRPDPGRAAQRRDLSASLSWLPTFFTFRNLQGFVLGITQCAFPEYLTKSVVLDGFGYRRSQVRILPSRPPLCRLFHRPFYTSFYNTFEFFRQGVGHLGPHGHVPLDDLGRVFDAPPGGRGDLPEVRIREEQAGDGGPTAVVELDFLPHAESVTPLAHGPLVQGCCHRPSI